MGRGGPAGLGPDAMRTAVPANVARVNASVLVGHLRAIVPVVETGGSDQAG